MAWFAAGYSAGHVAFVINANVPCGQAEAAAMAFSCLFIFIATRAAVRGVGRVTLHRRHGEQDVWAAAGTVLEGPAATSADHGESAAAAERA